MQLRLLITEECDRACEGCCNKDWDLKALPIAEDFTTYDMIMLTGGEPLLKLGELAGAIFNIRVSTDAPIVVYTAMCKNPWLFSTVLAFVDGITLTLHEHTDAHDFMRLCSFLKEDELKDKSMRLNIFKDVEVKDIPPYWKVKKDMVWEEDCPLPTNEEFMRLR